MTGHIVLVKDLLEGQSTLGHFLQVLPLKSDADAPAPVAVALPLGRVVPAEGKAGGEGGILLFQLLPEQMPDFLCPFRVSLLVQPVHDCGAQPFHKVTHLRRIVHA